MLAFGCIDRPPLPALQRRTAPDGGTMPGSRATAPRYAIYYAPHGDGPLWAFGSAWLGRDAATNSSVERPCLPGDYPPARLPEITREPWLYGFHATLKSPFALASGITEVRLIQTLRAFTASRRPFQLPPLQLDELSGFLALTLANTPPALHALADDCVRVFDPFRLPPDAAEIARRRHCGLTARQEELLLRWGYPFVMDEWQFHLTLTSRLEADERVLVRNGLAPLLAPLLRQALVVDSVCLFRQDQLLSPFRLVERYRFGG